MKKKELVSGSCIKFSMQGACAWGYIIYDFFFFFLDLLVMTTYEGITVTACLK